MTKSTATVEQMETEVAAFYLWEVAGKPVSIQLSLDLVDRLAKDVSRASKPLPNGVPRWVDFYSEEFPPPGGARS